MFNIVMQILQKKMQTINTAEDTDQHNLTEISNEIVGTLNDMGLRLMARTRQKNIENLIFSSRVAFPKSQQLGDIVWEITPTHKTIKVRIKLCGAEGSSSWGVTQCLRQNLQELSEFIGQVNNLKLKTSEGYFYIHPTTGELGFQSRINSINFITSHQKLLKVLKSKLKTYLQIFLEELQTIIFYFKIPGFTLQQYELHLQPKNQINLRKQIQKVNAYREYFQIKRMLSKGLPPSYPHVIMQNCSFLYGNNCFSGYLTPQLGFTPNETFARLEYDFQHEKTFLLKDLEKYQLQNFDPILTTIQIKEKCREKIIDSGGFSQIFSGIYSFIPQLSIHKVVTDSVEPNTCVKTGYHLVKKRGNNKQKQVQPALQNQFSFLYFIRNKVCPYFAKYYCNNTIVPFSDGEVYLQYYPCSLASCHLTEKQKIKVMEDICMGLLFMNQEGLIHRDLKELNIMVDRKKRGRLIDFGSVSAIPGSSNFKPFDDKIRSTEGYFLPYSQVEKHLRIQSPKMSRQDYYNHRNFDQYGLGTIFRNEFFLEHITKESHFLRYNLNYLVSKCQEMNPDDRLSFLELTIFLRQLMLFNIARSQFWKVGFDPKCKPHIFGQLQGEREMKVSENTSKSTSKPQQTFK